MGPETPDNRFTILLWFVLTKVNNESSEIIRSLNSAFDEFLPEKYAKRDFYPGPLREKIDEINSWVYDLYNNGVYKVCPSCLGVDIRLVSQVLRQFVRPQSRTPLTCRRRKCERSVPGNGSNGRHPLKTEISRGESTHRSGYSSIHDVCTL